ncbi:hypothetical protein P9112_000752 [Eukaryota sp. TZLM1-RC]
MSQAEFDTALQHFNELKAQDSRFIKFESTLFSETARDLDPNTLTNDQISIINEALHQFLTCLTPYFLTTNSHVTLDFLIKRYSLTTLPHHVVPLITMALPYFETKLFARLISVTNLSDTMFSFLSLPQNSNAHALTRDFFFKHVASNLNLFAHICSLIDPTNLPCKPAFNLVLMTSAYVLPRGQDAALAKITPLLLNCIRAKNLPECQLVAIGVFNLSVTFIPVNSDGEQEYWTKIMTATLKHCSVFTAESVAVLLLTLTQKGHVMTVGNRNIQRIVESKVLVKCLTNKIGSTNVLPLFKLIIPGILKRAEKIQIFQDVLDLIIPAIKENDIELIHKIPELSQLYSTQSVPEVNQMSNQTVDDEMVADATYQSNDDGSVSQLVSSLTMFISTGANFDFFTMLTHQFNQSDQSSIIALIDTCIYDLTTSSSDPVSVLMSFIYRLINVLEQETIPIYVLTLQRIIEIFGELIITRDDLDFSFFLPCLLYINNNISSPSLLVKCSEIRQLITTEDPSIDFLFNQLAQWRRIIPSISAQFGGLIASKFLAKLCLQGLSPIVSESSICLLSNTRVSEELLSVVLTSAFYNAFTSNKRYYQNKLIRVLLTNYSFSTEITVNVVKFVFSNAKDQTISILNELLLEKLGSLDALTEEDCENFAELNYFIKIISTTASTLPLVINSEFNVILTTLFKLISHLQTLTQSNSDFVLGSILSVIPNLAKSDNLTKESVASIIKCCGFNSTKVSSNALDCLAQLSLSGSETALEGLSIALTSVDSTGISLTAIRNVCKSAVSVLVKSKKVTIHESIKLIVDVIKTLPKPIILSLFSDLVDSFGSTLPLVYAFFYYFSISTEKEFIIVLDFLDNATNTTKLDFLHKSLEFVRPDTDLSFYDISKENSRIVLRVLTSKLVEILSSIVINTNCASVFVDALRVVCRCSAKKKFSFAVSHCREMISIISSSISVSEFVATVLSVLKDGTEANKLLILAISTQYVQNIRGSANLNDSLFAELLDCLFGFLESRIYEKNFINFNQASLLFVSGLALSLPTINTSFYDKMLSFICNLEISLLSFELFPTLAETIGSIISALKTGSLKNLKNVFLFISNYLVVIDSNILPILVLFNNIVEAVPRLINSSQISVIITTISSINSNQKDQHCNDLMTAICNRLALYPNPATIITIIKEMPQRLNSISFCAELLSKISNVLSDDDVTSLKDLYVSAIYECFDFFRIQSNPDIIMTLPHVSQAFLNYVLRLSENDLHPLFTAFVSWLCEPAAVLSPSFPIQGYGITSTADSVVDLHRWMALLSFSKVVVSTLGQIADPLMSVLSRHFVATIGFLSGNSIVNEFGSYLTIMAQDLFSILSHWFSTAAKPINDEIFSTLAPALCQSLLLCSKPSFEIDFVVEKVIPVIGLFVNLTRSEHLWHVVNNKVLSLLRSDNEDFQNLAVLALIEVYERLKEEALVLLPSSLPFLTELAEQSDLMDSPVHTLLKLIESLSGESMESLVG